MLAIQVKPNTIVQYKGGGYDGCFWEQNYAYFDGEGNFHNIVATGRNGCETEEAMLIATTCLAHCYRGNPYSGVLWAVWERTFTINGQRAQPTERWITCDLLRYQKDAGWGFKDMDESMHPFYYSCPIKYLDLVPVDQYGGNPEWREGFQEYHARQKERRPQRTPAKTA